MSGRISVDDRDLDRAARALRSARGGLSGLGGQLNDGLADGAPPEIAATVRAAVTRARRSVSAVDGRLDWRASELTRRAAWARIASGEGRGADLAIMLSWGAGKIAVKDVAGGGDEAFARWAKHWEKHYLRRNPGIARQGIPKLRAWLMRKTHWVERQRPILKHAQTVKRLRVASKVIRYGSIALDARDIVTSKGPVKQNESIGSAAGGMAGAYAGAQVGAALGTLGGPIGVAVGGGVGAMVGAAAGSVIGKKIGHAIGKTSVGKGIGKGIDGAKKAFGGAGKLIKKVKLW